MASATASPLERWAEAPPICELGHHAACLHGACPTLLPVPRRDREHWTWHAIGSQVQVARAVQLSQVLCLKQP